ncbi:MAG: chemotaxis protein CheW [Oscillospiraceae bacterium]|jgi:purine-binding chemotaxis protein CheW|nr:chemotaxis protein CheW [Oscillospiraceae bacterium]
MATDIWKKFEESNAEEENDLQSNEQKYLTFLIEKQYFAFSIYDIETIIEIQEIFPIPEFPDYAKGIINLRGLIIPVIDVRLRFHKPETEYNERTCIIIVAINKIQIGFIVDTVDEVVDIEPSNISNLPKIGGGSNPDMAKYIIGVGKAKGKIIMLLAADKILNEEELKAYEDMYLSDNAEQLS